MRPLRYIAVDRGALRSLLVEDGVLSDLVLATFIARREALQRVQASAWRSSARIVSATMRMLDFARSYELPFTWRDSARTDDSSAAALVAGLDEGACRWCDCRAAPSSADPRRARFLCAGNWPRAHAAGGGRPARRRRRSRGPRQPPSTVLPRARHAGDREDGPRRTRGFREGSRLPGIPGRHQRNRAHEPCSHPGAEVDARMATLYRAVSLEPGNGRHVVRLEDDPRLRRAPPARNRGEYRRLPVDGLSEYEGRASSMRPDRPRRSSAARRGRRGRGRQLRRTGGRLARSRWRDRDTAPSRRRSTRDDVGLSVRDLERGGVAVRDEVDRRPTREGWAARGRHAQDPRAPAFRSCSLPRRPAVHRGSRRGRTRR